MFVCSAEDSASQAHLLTMWWSCLVAEAFCFFLNFYIGDAGNIPLVGDGTPLGATTVVTPESADCVHWQCCILASL